MSVNPFLRIMATFAIALLVANVSAQCTLSASLPDTIPFCSSTPVLLSPIVTGGPAATAFRWSPSAGLSDTTILNPTATVSSIQKYHFSAFAPLPGNLVTNPAFTNGNTGFTSAYIYSTTVNAPGRYLLMANPGTLGPNWPNPGDHTTGTGLLMVVDGSTSPNVSFWCQSIPVSPNTYYELSAWTFPAYPPPAQLKFTINGIQVGDIYPVSNPNVWSQYKAIWYSGSSVNANICITDTNLVLNGNDFYIDDIAFHQLCTAKDSVVVNPNPLATNIAIYVSPNDTVCQGTDVVFVASPTNGGTAPQYQWYKNGNPISGANGITYQVQNFNTGDYFSCELTSNAPCATPIVKMSNSINLTIIPTSPAVVNITANPGLLLSPWQLVTFTANSLMAGTAPTYQWLRNGQLVIGAISDTWGANNLTNGDVICAVLHSNDPCAFPATDTSNKMVVNIKTGINDISGDNDLVIYPNPNKGKFTISNLPSGDVKLEIVNSLGQVIYKQELTSNRLADHTISADILPGVYILNLISGVASRSAIFSVY